MSDLKEYLDLKKQYEKLDNLVKNVQAINEVDQTPIMIEFSELLGWFLVRMQDLVEKANE